MRMTSNKPEKKKKTGIGIIDGDRYFEGNSSGDEKEFKGF